MTRTRNPLIIEFCKRWSAQRPSLAVVKAVTEAFPSLSHSTPPIDPYALAKLRGVISIVETDIEPDGLMFELEAGHFAIQLNKNSPENRKRFTLAHELGHTFFYEVRRSLPRAEELCDTESKLVLGDPEEERLCNVAAREILMPQPQFSALIEQLGYCSRAVLSLAATFGTSVRSAAIRLVELCPYRVMVCEWQKNSTTGAYETAWTARSSSVRMKPNSKFCIGSDQPGYRVFEARRDYSGREWISLCGPLDHYFIDMTMLSETDGRMVTSIILDKSAEIIARPIQRARPDRLVQTSLC